jgi:uncharacterized membrane protein YgcG
VEKPLYQKTQIGFTSLAVVLILLLFVHVIGRITLAPALVLHIEDIIGGVIVIPLLTLTLRVTPSSVEWWFSLGLARQRVALSEIAGARTIKTSIMSGFGVHGSGGSALWAVSGFRAVMMDLSDGRHIAVSSDEPERVVELIESLRRTM